MSTVTAPTRKDDSTSHRERPRRGWRLRSTKPPKSVLSASGGRIPTKRRKKITIKRVFIWLGLAFCTVVFIYPFLWLVSASFKPRADVFDNRLIPKTFTFDNYVQVWQDADIAMWLLNSIVVAVLAATCVTLSSAIVAWGFAYFRFPGRKSLFALVMATMMLPGAVTMIPVYLIWNQLGLVGSDAPMNGLIPMWGFDIFASAFYIFMIRQFFLAMPRDTFEAAQIDGANNWRIFRQIALPLAKPALVATFLFEAQASWVDLMRSLIYLQNSTQFTVPRGLKAMVDQFGYGGEWDWQIVVTGAVITTIPMIVLFFIGQRHFIEGISMSGRKG